MKIGFRRYHLLGSRTGKLSAVVAVFAISALIISSMAPRAYAAIAVRGGSITASNTAGATSLAFTATPTGIQAGDLMILALSVYSTTAVPTVTGWTALPANSSVTVTNMKSYVYYRIATSSETNLTVTYGATSVRSSGIITAFSGVDTSNPAGNSMFADTTVAAKATTTASTSLTTNAYAASNAVGVVIVAAFGGYSTASNTAITVSAVAGTNPTMACATTCSTAFTNNKNSPTPYSSLEYGTLAAAATVTARSMTASVALARSGFTFALKPAPVISQTTYKWFANSTTSGAVGTQLAAQDTVATGPAVGTSFRLRMQLGVAGVQLTSLYSFKLQYAYSSTGGSCATQSYADVSTSSPIAFYDNTSTADGYQPLTGDTITGTPILETYEEANNFSALTTIAAGQSGLWDFALVFTNGAASSGSYCLRTVYSDGTSINGTYTKYPEVNAPITTITQANYRWFMNADSSVPGAPLATQDTNTSINSGDKIRLRQRLAVNVNGVGTSFVPVLQYAEKVAGTCGSYAAVVADSSYVQKRGTLIGQMGDVAASPWSAVTNAVGLDGLSASVSVGGTSGASDRISTGNYGFSIPSNATILGIKVAVKAGGGSVSGSTMSVEILKADIPQEMKTDSPYFRGTSFGSSSDLWSTTWLPSDINASTFGATFRATDSNFSTSTYTVDDIAIGVYYTTPNTSGIYLQTNSGVAHATAAQSVAGDPTNGGRTAVLESYISSDDTTVALTPNIIYAGQDGLWDFSLGTTTAGVGKTYCFRVVNNGGGLLDSYTYIPEITINALTGSTLDQQLRGGQSVVEGQGKQPFTW